ncbi:MAG: glycoside-pentoside-hexuronide (GPH):cation symporter [Oscillospiraceae bacterium]|nr:glycoside-pentoside-hexuronide (GPH):cation symporter [Oscillospiraceae bacterium]MDE7172225.1 glycoside-pentoside-hexuronide (GPH):cation symporter [Oscillospiraceae bacterium]
MENGNITKRNLICYPIGTIGRDALYALINSYLLTFVLFTHTLDAAQLTAITGIMIAARVFDALNDPIMGNIIERTRSKYGKFKPWLVAGALSTSVVIYLMFNMQLQGWNFVWFFGVMYFAFSITYTMNDISYWGMIPALGSDANTRNQFTSRATLCAGIGSTLASMLIPMFTTGSGAIGGSTTTAYGWVALGIAVAAPLFLLFTVFGVREHREAAPANHPKEKFSLIQVFKTIARNDQLVWVAVIFLIQQVGNGLVIGGLGSTYIYFTFGYSGGLYSLFNTVGMMATAFLMIFYPAISRKLHRKKLMGIMTVVSTVGYILMLASAAIPGTGMGRFGLLTVGFMSANFGYYSFYLIMMISIMNTVEYNELKFGERDEGIITSLRPFITKMGSAIIVAATSATYLIFGVTGYTNQISDLEQQCAQGLLSEEQKLSAIEQVLFGGGGVSGGQSMGLLITMTVLPWALMLISYFLYKKKYKLDEAEYDRICRELGKK